MKKGKRIYLAGLVIWLVLAISTLAFAASYPPTQIVDVEETNCELQDVYLKISGFKPIHLICTSIKKQNIYLGDKFGFWIDVKVIKSPCPRTEEESCFWKLELVTNISGDKEKTWTLSKMEDHLTDGAVMQFCFGAHIPRKAILGDATIRFRLTRGEETFYLYEIPIEIK